MGYNYTHEKLAALVLEQPRKATTCKHCKKTGLQWVSHGVTVNQTSAVTLKWLLVEVSDDGSLERHTCDKFGKG